MSSSESFQSLKGEDELPIFIKWMDFVKWLLVALDKFPKKVRFTLSDRLIQLALGVTEELVEARYSAKKGVFLKRASIGLEKIRMLLRISYEMRVLAPKGYENSVSILSEIGKMLGGWMSYQGKKENDALG